MTVSPTARRDRKPWQLPGGIPEVPAHPQGPINYQWRALRRPTARPRARLQWADTLISVGRRSCRDYSVQETGVTISLMPLQEQGQERH